MPLYDVKCTKCKKEINNHFTHSYKESMPVCCGIEMIRKVNTGIISGFPEFGITLTNVAEKPVHFDSKKKMQDYAKTHNLELGALL